MSQRPPRHPITVDEYYRLAETGALSPEARVELIEGEIVSMSPIGLLHEGIVTQLSEWLASAGGTRALVRVQQSIRLSEHSEPQPDIVIARRRSDYYATSRLTPSDTFLLIEVSDSSLHMDRYLKVPLYARHAVPEVWICDLTISEMHVFRSPAQGQYTHTYSIGKSGIVRLAAFEDIAIDLSQLVWP